LGYFQAAGAADLGLPRASGGVPGAAGSVRDFPERSPETLSHFKTADRPFVPFIRTSDLSNWEIKADFKHGVSEDIYEEVKGGCDVAVGDILMVRDGTYLIGTSVFVTEKDVPMLFQSHIFRIRVLKPEVVNPFLLFTSLNAPIVKAQVRSKQFTQDIIDTLGNRVLELILPIPRDRRMRENLACRAKEVIEQRAKYRDGARMLPTQLQGKVIGEVEDEVEEVVGIVMRVGR